MRAPPASATILLVRPRHSLLALAALAGCGAPKALPPARPAAVAVDAGAVVIPSGPSRPVMVGDAFVDPATGAVVGTLAGAAGLDAVPEGDGRFHLGPLHVDAATRAVIARDPPAAVIEDRRVLLRDGSGAIVWTVDPGGGVGSVRPPDVGEGGGRVFAATDSGVFALERASGRVLWSVPGPSDRLLLLGDRLYATDCSVKQDGSPRLLVGRDVATGAEKARFELPRQMDPDAFAVVAPATLLVRDDDVSLLVDLSGARAPVVLAERVTIARPWAGGFLVVTSKRVAFLGPGGETRREVAGFAEDDFVQGADIVPLDGGDLLVVTYCRISDSGVGLLRLDPALGVVWRTRAKALGVAHSEYLHQAYVEARGATLVVVSVGSYGTFIELRAAADGALVHRQETRGGG